MCRGSKNWYKLTEFMAFGHFLYIFIPPKVEMNSFSGRISLCRLLRYSGPQPFHVLLFICLILEFYGVDLPSKLFDFDGFDKYEPFMGILITLKWL